MSRGSRLCSIRARRRRHASDEKGAARQLDQGPTALAAPGNAAYSSAFCLARVALEACGYRLAGAEGHRVAVFQNLANTLEWEGPRWRRLDDMHRLRNRFDYGDVVEVSEPQLQSAIAGAQDLFDDLVRVFAELKP